MADGEMRPQSDTSGPAGAHYRADDDIELPPIDDATASTVENGSAMSNSPNGGLSSLLGSAVLLGAVLIGGWYLWSGGASEKDHPSWQNVAAATDASTNEVNATYLVSKSGKSALSTKVETTSMDVDRVTTRKVRSALKTGLAEAQATIQAAQGSGVKIADLAGNLQLLNALKDGKHEFFEVYLFDCCDEDGDVVEVLLNGSLFATVPITHDGTSLSIPLQKGNNDVAMRGIRDGGGGVTVSLRSSRGDYFCRSMRVGQEYHMEVVAP